MEIEENCKLNSSMTCSFRPIKRGYSNLGGRTAGANFFPNYKGKDKFIRGLDGGNLKEIENLKDLDLDGTII
jgi:hypothetical protein